ncbi:G-protein coupled receptor 35-like [Pristis pectinata]|uniref:G-protein coupled receptor 35-like n=1 Tax=Pristis pectinata TaxID=685728 RepID=UPI00223CDBA9|nr:G-protein coupled receptor 35-like [Pristis pectinata]
MNCSNHTQNHPDSAHQVILLLFTVPTFFIGSALNGAALYTICCAIKQRTKPFIYMVNLVISDTLLLFSLPFKVYAFYVKEDWILKMEKSFCQFLESLCFVNNYTSILVITLICVDRYVAVRYPFNARTNSSPRTIAGICAFIWITVCICTINIYFKSQSKSCFYFISADVLRLEFIIPLGVLVLICALTMLFCSLHIIHSLNTRASETLDGCKDKCVKILLSNLFTFLICFTPYHTVLLLYSLAVNGSLSGHNCERLRLALHCTLYLANVNCCLDAIYYFYAIKELRRSQQIPDKKIQMDVCDTSVSSTVNQSRNSHSH